MAKASEIQLDYEKQSFLFKSPPGFGKTLAAASFALEGPVFLSYWDKKSPVELVTFFRQFGSLGKTILDNIDYEVYSSLNAGAYLDKLITMRDDCRYFAIINDSITYMTSAAVNWSLNFGKNPDRERKMKDIIASWDEYKTETGLVSQCMDISRGLPCHVIWTAHPLPTTKVEGSGAGMKVSKVNSIVSYGSKVAAIIPGGFTEIYHFSQDTLYDPSTGKSSKRYIANLDSVGDEFAKSPMLANYCKEIDFTDRPFYTCWKEKIKEAQSQMKQEDEAAITND